jgi:hypothetical protein
MAFRIFCRIDSGNSRLCSGIEFRDRKCSRQLPNETEEKFVGELAAAANNEVKITIHAGGSLDLPVLKSFGVVRDGLIPIGSFQFAQQVGVSRLVGAINYVPQIAFWLPDCLGLK